MLCFSKVEHYFFFQNLKLALQIKWSYDQSFAYGEYYKKFTKNKFEKSKVLFRRVLDREKNNNIIYKKFKAK